MDVLVPDRESILLRLGRLRDLCVETERDNPTDSHLFSNQYLNVEEMIDEVREIHTGRKALDVDSERKLMIDIMKRANKIWKIRNKVKNGEIKDLDLLEVHETVEEFLSEPDVQKINAIKYYREVMTTHFDEKVGLKEAKDYVDAVHNDMKNRRIANEPRL